MITITLMTITTKTLVNIIATTSITTITTMVTRIPRTTRIARISITSHSNKNKPSSCSSSSSSSSSPSSSSSSSSSSGERQPHIFFLHLSKNNHEQFGASNPTDRSTLLGIFAIDPNTPRPEWGKLRGMCWAPKTQDKHVNLCHPKIKILEKKTCRSFLQTCCCWRLVESDM